VNALGNMGSAGDLDLLLDTIYSTYHYDFRGYSRSPLERRVGGAYRKLGYDSLRELQQAIVRDPAIFTALLDHLTIQFSEMFRDPSYFRSLRDHVLPILRTYPSLKVWCAGCGCGEEAYSLAILFREERLLERTIIYATDINFEALRKAKAAIYPIERMRVFSANYLESGGTASLSDYYTAAYGAATIDKSLQQHILFADHSLATDHVFSEIHFVSCRNVLIYFDQALKSRCVRLFDEALCARGFLGLGAKEGLYSLGSADSFEVISAADRIYRKTPAKSRKEPAWRIQPRKS